VFQIVPVKYRYPLFFLVSRMVLVLQYIATAPALAAMAEDQPGFTTPGNISRPYTPGGLLGRSFVPSETNRPPKQVRPPKNGVVLFEPYTPVRLPDLPKNSGVSSVPYTPVRLPDLPAKSAVPSEPQAPAKLSAPDKAPKPFKLADQTMRFAIVRNASASCEPACPEWIAASGTITADSPSRLRKVLRQLGKRRLPIVIESNGGAVDAAMEIGRLIRKRGLDVAVGKTSFYECDPDQKGCKPKYSDGAYAGFAYPGWAACMSACPFIVAGGSKRFVGLWAELGVHQITTTVTKTMVKYQTRYRIVKGKKKIVDTKIIGRRSTGTYKTTELSKGYRKRLNAYFNEMGVDAGIVAKMLSIPASDISILDHDELLNFRMTTGPGDVGDFSSASTCAQEPKPANCIELSAIVTK
jgi:hypothetical protein